MRILLYNDISRAHGGAESFIQVIQRQLQIEGHTASLFSFTDYLPHRISWWDKWQFLQSSQWKDEALLRSFRKRIREFKPDLIHIHNNRFFTATVMQALEQNPIPVISSFHDYDLLDFISKPNSLKARLKKRQFNMILRGSDALACPTLSQHAMFETFQAQAYYLPYFLDDKDWDYQPNAWRRPPHLVYVGRMIPEKGIFSLLNAFKKVQKVLPTSKLSYLGKGKWAEKLHAQIKILGFEERVDILGFLPQKAVQEVLNTASCLILPSEYHELFGIVGIEAQAMGIPCIASDIGGIGEWCKHKVSGMLFPPAHIDELANSIVEMHTDHQLAELCVEGGKQSQKMHYSAEQISPKLLEMYETEIRKKRRKPPRLFPGHSSLIPPCFIGQTTPSSLSETL